MKLTRPKELRRIDIGFAVYGGHTAPIMAHVLYRIDWSDGTSSIERGRTLHTMPGITRPRAKQARDVRPDLAPHMQAVKTLMDPIRQVCLDLDQPQSKSKSKKSKPRAK